MLHHYTTVNTLALILRHQTLRFTRLDQFDDVTEGSSLGLFPFGARMFASCWSAEEVESIPQWAMYGDAMKGVRLSLRLDPFVWHTIDFKWHEKFEVLESEAPFTLEEMLGPDITLTPLVEMKSAFGQKVNYVSDVAKAIKGFAAVSPDGVALHGKGTEIAFLKSDNWAFQKEYRYVFPAHAGPPQAFSGDPSAYLEARKIWQESGVDFLTDIPIHRHIDLKLDHGALSCAEILIGPLALPGTLEIVESLVAKYAVGARVRVSELSGTIRAK